MLRLADLTADVEAGQQALRAYLNTQAVSDRALYHAELAFEELVVNVMRHAYGNRAEGTGRIDVRACIRGDEIVLTVEDEGPPFDPCQAAAPPPPSSIEDAKIGGLGLPLVRMAAKRMEYRREGNRNQVTIGIPRR